MNTIDARKKPMGIIIVASYTGIGVLLGVFTAFILFANGMNLGITLMAIFTIALSAVGLALTYGLFTFQLWSYRLTLIYYWIGIVISIVMILIDFSISNIISNAFFIAIDAWILNYFYSEKIINFYDELLN